MWCSLCHVFPSAIGPRGIRVNTVNPATVKTDMFNKPDGPGGNAEKKQAVSNIYQKIIDMLLFYIRVNCLLFHRNSTIAHILAIQPTMSSYTRI